MVAGQVHCLCLRYLSGSSSFCVEADSDQELYDVCICILCGLKKILSSYFNYFLLEQLIPTSSSNRAFFRNKCAHKETSISVWARRLYQACGKFSEVTGILRSTLGLMGTRTTPAISYPS